MAVVALNSNRAERSSQLSNKQLDPTRAGFEAEKLKLNLRKRIVGQDEAIEQIVNVSK
jgi:hypothetical protein